MPDKYREKLLILLEVGKNYRKTAQNALQHPLVSTVQQFTRIFCKVDGSCQLEVAIGTHAEAQIGKDEADLFLYVKRVVSGEEGGQLTEQLCIADEIDGDFLGVCGDVRQDPAGFAADSRVLVVQIGKQNLN